MGSKVGVNGLSCVGDFIPISSYEEYFINSIDAMNVTKVKDYLIDSSESNNPELKPFLNELNNLKIKELDNPVLVFYRLKKHSE